MTKIRSLFEKSGKKFVPALCLVAALTVAFAGTVFAAGTVVQGSRIGEDKAKEAAYADAKIDPAAVESVRVEYDVEHGQALYEVDFYAGGAEYEYSVKASDGTVLKKEVELIRTDGSRVRAKAQIMVDKAREIALADAGLTLNDVIFIKDQLDIDDGVSIYELEFCTASLEYNYEIDANTGAIYKKSSEPVRDADGRRMDGSWHHVEDHNDHSDHHGTVGNNSAAGGSGANNSGTGGSGAYIDVEKAKSIALAHAGLSAGDVVFTKAKLDYDDGYVEYEIEFRKGRMEYEYTINALTGAILESESEWDD